MQVWLSTLISKQGYPCIDILQWISVNNKYPWMDIHVFMDISLELSLLLWISIWISIDFYWYPRIDLLWTLDPVESVHCHVMFETLILASLTRFSQLHRRIWRTLRSVSGAGQRWGCWRGDDVERLWVRSSRGRPWLDGAAQRSSLPALIVALPLPLVVLARVALAMTRLLSPTRRKGLCRYPLTLYFFKVAFSTF